LIPVDEYEIIKQYTYALFRRGTEMAAQKGLILVDTKYEFGKGSDGKIYLCDEIHTPDSSRYFYLDGYDERQSRGEQQRQLSKEFVREWLMANGFMGKEGQQVPAMSDEWIREISERYIELFEVITGEKFNRTQSDNILERVERNINSWLKT
jgi:phosphoribosylaminoimidazole-succinocarboxamide synthase